MPNTAGAFGLNDIRYVEALKVERYARLIERTFDYPRAADYFPCGADERLAVPPRTLALLGVLIIILMMLASPRVRGGRS